MNIKNIILILLLLILIFPCSAEKLGEFLEIYKPEQVAVDDDNIYIVQGQKVFVYSLDSLSPVVSFGEKGAGPREFSGIIRAYPGKDSLLVTSPGKVSYFSKDGRFIKELKTRSVKEGQFLPHTDGFIGHGYAVSEKRLIYRTINFYDSQMNKTGEVFRYSYGNSKSGKKRRYNLMDRQTWPITLEGENVIVVKPDGNIIVMDKTGKKNKEFAGDYKIVKFTLAHQKDLIDKFLLAQPGKSGSYNQWKNRIDFPEFFPPVQTIKASEGMVLILTHFRDQGKGEIFLFKTNGDLLKKMMIPVFDYSPKNTFPLTFFKDRVYQVVENPKTEEWELHVVDVFE